MKKIFICLLGLVLLGAGCTKNKPAGVGLAENSSVAEISFCDKQQQEALTKIQGFKLAEEAKPFFVVWKDNFLKMNDVDSAYFESHVFPIEVRERKDGEYENFNFIYYLKLNDIYFDSRSGEDVVRVKISELEKFKKEALESLLKEFISKDINSFNEIHPDFGKLPVQAWYKYTWGNVKTTNLRSGNDNTLPDVMSCIAATELLKTCRNDIVPQSIVYKPMLNYMWISGGIANSDQIKDPKGCASATLDLQKKKIDFCAASTSCSTIIF